MKEIRIEELKRFSVEALKRAGTSAEHAEVIAEALVTTDMFGVCSHGTKNLLNYIRKMQAGGLDPHAEPEIEAEGPAWAVVNGNCGMGIVSAVKAMKLAMEKAAVAGIAYVGVKNSCHFGAAGYYANLAAQRGMIGISMSNADPNMVIPNSSDVAIGNNPFSFAAPLKNGRTVFLDVALSNVAALKVVNAREKGEKVPKEWLVDDHGTPTDDPSGCPETSHLRPMAAHKGSGLAVMVELFSSVLTGSGILSDVTSWNLDLAKPNHAGHAFIAVDISHILPMRVFEASMERLARELHGAKKAEHADRTYLPGEMEWDKYDAASERGTLQLTEVMEENMLRLSEMFELPLKLTDHEQGGEPKK